MMSRIVHFLETRGHAAVWLIAMFGLSVPALAESSLTPHSAEYKVKISILGGNLTTKLSATDSGYVAAHMIKATGMSRMIAGGSITESSQFDISNDGIRPTKYVSLDTLSRDKTKAEVWFDWDAGEARGTVNGENVMSELDDLAFDRVSIQYELMHDLLNGGLDTQYTLFDVDELKTINVSSAGRKRVKVPAGEFDAVGVRHQSENSSRVTTLWCVEELGFLPVIIEQHRKGKLRVRATLRKYTPDQT
jgi:hypothetical protein